MELRQIETFVRVAQMNSFSKAAKSLGYSQAAVTVQIQLLERDLNTRLFDRLGKRIALTAQGQAFLTHAYAVIHELNKAHLTLDETTELKGSLHIGTIDSLCYTKLPPILRHFRTAHPEVRIRITTASPEELFEMMRRNQVDVIYVLDDPRYDNNWHKAMEGREEVVFAASPSLGLGGRTALQLDELLAYPFFLTEPNENYRRAFDRCLASRGKVIQTAIESSNTEFIIKMLEENAGISLLPLFSVRESVKAGRISMLHVTDFNIVMYRQIFYHRDKWKTREMEEFIRLAKEDADLCQWGTGRSASEILSV